MKRRHRSCNENFRKVVKKMINKINYPQNNFYEKEKQKAKDTIEKRKKD